MNRGISLRYLSLSGPVIFDVLRAIISRPISTHTIRTNKHPLISTTSGCRQLLNRVNKQFYATNTRTDTHMLEKKTFPSYKNKKKTPDTVEEFNRRMIFATRENRQNKALKYFREMENKHLKPDIYSYTIIINGFSKRSDLDRASYWLDRMLKNGIQPDAYIYTSLIDGYMREANVDKAEDMFRIMMQKNIKPELVTYNILMHHSIKQLNMESALKFWGNLLEAGLRSDVYTFAIIMHGLSNEGRVDEAWRIFKSMQQQNVDVNEVIATTLMGMHVKQKDNEYAIQLFNKFFDPRSPDALKPTNHTRTVLLNALISKIDKQALSAYYEQYLNTINDPTPGDGMLFLDANVYTYTSFMRAFLRHNDLDMVNKVYHDMRARHIQPTLVTYATIMLAYAFIPDPEACSRILNELKAGGVELNAVIYTITMRAWAKAGRWENVKKTYEMMKENNIQPNKSTMEVLRWSRENGF